MKNDSLENQLRELGWRRKLTLQEEDRLRSWLAAHPEAGAAWETEGALTELLGRLPDVPVATNFTARVMQAIERERAESASAGVAKGSFLAWVHRWLPRTAIAAVVLGAGMITYRFTLYQVRDPQLESLRVVSGVDWLPNPKILQDLDAIRAIGQTPPPDEELLRLLQ
jgi:hypothetical protein